MKDSHGRAVGTCIVGLGLLAFVISAPAGDRRRSGYPESAEAAEAIETLGGIKAGTPAAQLARTAHNVVEQWPEGPQRLAKRLLEKYGPPAEFSEARLVWTENGPWRRTVVYRDEQEHNFPSRHFDSLEQSVHYRVPVEKLDELGRLDGSLLVDRTSGLLASRCDREEMNFLALNLAHDVVRGAKGVEEARQFFGKTSVMTLAGKSTPYTEGLLFTTARADSADPDRPVVEQAKP